LVPALFTFYIQGVLKLKKNNSSAKGLNTLAGLRQLKLLVDRFVRSVCNGTSLPVLSNSVYSCRCSDSSYGDIRMLQICTCSSCKCIQQHVTWNCVLR